MQLYVPVQQQLPALRRPVVDGRFPKVVQSEPGVCFSLHPLMLRPEVWPEQVSALLILRAPKEELRLYERQRVRIC